MKAWYLAILASVALTLPALADGVEPAVGTSAGAVQPAIEQFAQTSLADLTGSLSMEFRDQQELNRMGKDFRDVYRFSKARVEFLEPGMMRMETKAGFFKVLMLQSHDRKMLSVPLVGIRNVHDISHSPSSRQGLLELGLLTPSLLDSVEVKPLGAAVVEGVHAWRYELTYKGETFLHRQEVAVDPATRVLVERRVYESNGALKVRFVYKDAVEAAAGVWVPAHVLVYSPSGKHAATMRYDKVQVNTGLKPEVFSF